MHACRTSSAAFQQPAISVSHFANQLQTLARIPDDDIARLTGEMTAIYRYPAAAEIAAEDSPSTTLRVLLDGCAYKFRHLSDGRRYISSVLIPGNVCDLDGFVGRSGLGVRAVTACVVAEIPHSKLRALLLDSETLRDALWQLSCLENAAAIERGMNLARRQAVARISHFFCELVHRMKAIDAGDDDVIAFPLTQEELGDALGLTPVHVNRSLQQLRRDGLISLNRNILRICNMRKLQALCEFSDSYMRGRVLPTHA